MRSTLRSRQHLARLAGPLFVALCLLAPPAYAADKVEILSVTASSTDGMLMDAVDGDASTAWQNRHPGERDAWLCVHFADTATVKGVKLQLDPLGADTAIDVETSEDGERYVAQAHGLHALKDHLDASFKPVDALFLRVRFHYAGKGTAPRFRLKELEPIGG